MISSFPSPTLCHDNPDLSVMSLLVFPVTPTAETHKPDEDTFGVRLNYMTFNV